MATKKEVRKAALKEMLSKHSKMNKGGSHKGMMDGMMAKMKGK